MSRTATAVAMVLALAAGSAAAQSTGAPSTTLKYGTWGFDLAGRDPATKPGDDFFRYANGAWLDHTAIPGDKPGVSLRLLMSDLAEARLHALVEEAAKTAGHEPKTLEGKVGAFYASFMDEARVEALGAKPIAPELDAIRAAKTREALGVLMGRTVRDFEGSAFNVGIDVDVKDISHYAVYLGQGGLGLPDRDYYLQASFAEKKAAWQAYIQKLLALENWPDPAGHAAAIVALETKIAKASWTRAEQRNPDTTYNPYTLAELEKAAPGFPWRGFFAEAGLGAPGKIIVVEKTALPKIAAIFAETPVDVLQAWLAFSVADNAAVVQATEESVALLGHIDILVNSAGITGATAPVDAYPVDSWLSVIDVNLNGLFYCCRAVVPHMVANGYGRIVNVASVAGKEGNPNASAYSASKAGVIGLTKSLGKELATRGVIVNAVTPATFDSPILEQLPRSQVDYMLSKIPMGRLGEVQETAAMVCFMASEECSFTTASTFDTSGGRTTF